MLMLAAVSCLAVSNSFTDDVIALAGLGGILPAPMAPALHSPATALASNTSCLIHRSLAETVKPFCGIVAG